jgi:hypothetical protein
MTLRSLCIHGHFYQPPREDPITGLIPLEVGAAPYKNWNERIHAECYRPNAELGNFTRISFNVGPTLFEWMETHDKETYQRIIAQDRVNVEKNGVGNAMAQAYNHTILPLATTQDKRTQIVWGIADFQHRFGRMPEGMWLPETAADLETLSILAEEGIQFTILAPWQAEVDVLDPSEPYRVDLPGGKNISVFFYNAELSSLISFDAQATTNADIFINQYLLRHFNEKKTLSGEPQVIVAASDGELYGHHKQFRDRFLSHLVNGGRINAGIDATYPGLWLKEWKPRRSISIRDDTSWSCHHGVMRWMGECGCTSGDGSWKTYLRVAFDRLADSLGKVYLEFVTPYIPDPYALRNRYIEVILDQSKSTELIHEMAGKRLEPDITKSISQLLEAQRERQRMFTSCGWFFEDFARIEPKNNVAYAAQAVRLTCMATGVNLAAQAYSELQNVLSYRTGLRGDTVFRRQYQRAETKTGSCAELETTAAAQA